MSKAMLRAVLMFLILAAAPAGAEKGTLKIGVFPEPPSLAATVKFVEPSGNNILDGGEAGKLIVAVRNDGWGEAFDVRGEITAQGAATQLEFPPQAAFGNIAPEGTATREIALRAGEDVRGGDANFAVRVKEGNCFDAEPLRLAFAVCPFAPPALFWPIWASRIKAGTAGWSLWRTSRSRPGSRTPVPLRRRAGQRAGNRCLR